MILILEILFSVNNWVIIMNILKNFSNTRISIPIILFIFSLCILSFNLEGQGIAIDEWFQHGHTMTMYDLLIQGKFNDNCITLLGECDTIII